MKAKITAAGALLLILATSALAQSAVELAGIPAHAKQALNVRELKIAPRTGRIPVRLPDGSSVRFVPVDQRERNGVQTLRGRQGSHRLLLTTDGKRAYGYVDDGVHHYRITTVSVENAAQGRREELTILVDASLLDVPLDLLGQAPVNDVVIDPRFVEQVRARMEQQAAGLVAADAAYSIIDIAIFLDPALLDIASDQALRTQAQAYVDFTNEAFRLNNIPGELRLVLVEMFPGTFAAFDPFPGFAGNAAMHARADQFNADLRHFVYFQRAGMSYCGKGYLVGASGVSGFQCGASTLAHEVGHNLGAHHDRANASGNVSLPINAYNYGYVCGGVGTIMSYVGNGRVPHYSDPSLTNGAEACGVAIGQPDAAHNAAAIDVIRTQVEASHVPQTTYGSVRFTATAFSFNETDGGGADITVTRDGDISQAVSVEAGPLDVTATQGFDYEADLVTLDFAAGEISKTVHLAALDDEEFEADETFRMVLRYPRGLTIAGDPVTVTLSSDDPDRGKAELEVASVSVWENGGPVGIAINRTGATTSALTISYSTADETALAGVQYQAVSGQLTFEAGEKRKMISVPIIDNDLYEQPDYRSFVFNLGGANLGATRTQWVSVFNDDPNRGRAQFAEATVEVAENAGTLNLTLNRIEGLESTLPLNYATVAGTAQAGRDFTATSGTLTFAAGEGVKTLAIPILDNPRYDGDRTFSVQISGRYLATNTTATVTVRNDDPNRGLAEFSASAYEIAETDGSLTITVNRIEGAQSTLSVNYATENGTALGGADFTPASGRLDFAAGATSSTITIPILDDNQYDPGESFAIRLTGDLLGATAVAAIAITNDDPNRGRAQFSGTSASVNETAGSVTLTVERTEGSESSLTVNYATSDGTARAGVDYQAANGALTFAASETSKAFQVSIINNTTVDAARAFNVALTGDYLGAPTSLTVTVDNDDSPPASGGSGGGGGGGLDKILLALATLLLAMRRLRRTPQNLSPDRDERAQKFN